MKYIIHRGITSKEINENTYKSIKKALQDSKSLGVEFDIRLTKDNIIVLSHNPNIGLNIIENMTYREILKKKYLTTLDKVLSIDTNKILLIDIKVANNYKHFANILLKTLPKEASNIYLCSFSKKIINYLKKRTNYKLSPIIFKYHLHNYPFIMINYLGISNTKIQKIKKKEIFLWTIHNPNELSTVIKKFPNIDNYYLIINKKE